MTRPTAALLAGALCIATPALAQDLYLGVGVGRVSGVSDQVSAGGGFSDLSANMLTVILGQRFESGSSFFGWEASADVGFGAETRGNRTGANCRGAATGSYLCSHDATLRLVAVFGQSIAPRTELFGTLGVGMLRGTFADNPLSTESASLRGLTVGAGITRDFGRGWAGRAEVIYDRFGHTTQDSMSTAYSGTTLRLSLVHRF